jgi:lipid II:glycine glycyltransferase (peptidoglycan interpeptide bridge formation enzyme)
MPFSSRSIPNARSLIGLTLEYSVRDAGRTQLGNGLTVEVDRADKSQWDDWLSTFSDTSIYQTWPYEASRSGSANVSRIVLKEGRRTLMAAQVRIFQIPFVKCGMAYVRWGPLWRRRNGIVDQEIFRHAVRALRMEYVIRRGLAVRLVPHVCEGDVDGVRTILAEEGFLQRRAGLPYRTIIMDIRPTLEELYRGLHQKWRNSLNAARKRNLEILEGEQDDLFEAFEAIYVEMLDRKQLGEGASLRQFRTIQRQLSAEQRMRVVLCKVEGQVSAGAICSALGDTGVYLFGATGDKGMKTNGSYMVQWRVLEWLKGRGCQWYNLNGINPARNAGTYRFKSRLAGVHGRDVRFLGQFDAYPNAAMRLLVSAAELLRVGLRSSRGPISPS